MQINNKSMGNKTTSTQSDQWKRFTKRFLIGFWGLFGAGVLTIFILFCLINGGLLGYMPPIEELQNPKNRLASEVFSADLESMGRYYIYENRVSVPYKDISPNVIKALVATEDVRYYDHTGIDFRGLMRAIVKMGKAGGGSTITQQLAKQMWSPRANSSLERFLQKPIEWVIATKLERLYSKEELLMMYLNQFDFLYNAVGIKSAALVYFNTTPDKLNMQEAAMLVGMCKNPSLYNPVRRPESALNRRNTVFDQMKKYGYISQQECDSLQALPIELSFSRIEHKNGVAPYFRTYLRQIMMAKKPKRSDYPEWNKEQYYIDKVHWKENPLYGWCNKNLKPDGTPYDLYQDGLRIYTTIDSHMQKYAEEAVDEHMRTLQKQFFREKKGKAYAPFSRKLKKEDADKIMLRSMRQSDRYRNMKAEGISDEKIQEVFNTPIEMNVFSYDGPIDTVMSPMDSIRWLKHYLRCSFVSVDGRTGAVKAYVGGTNFEHFQYDMISVGRRQVGSTIKPFLYTLAMSEGFSPCDEVENKPVTLVDKSGGRWTPKDGHGGGGLRTIRWGLQVSSNWITAYLMKCFSPEQMIVMMRSFGITSPLEPVASLCLGSCEINLQEMVSAYTTFTNKGMRLQPMLVTRIEDKNGKELATFMPTSVEVVNEETAYKMLDMLRAVMDAGTGKRARHRYGFKAQAGGKTGTSQNNSDGWFIGFTPSLVSGCWVGGEDRSIHFDRTAIGQGANTSLPIWANYMKKVFADKELGYEPSEKFDIPDWFNPNKNCIEENLDD